MRNFVAASRAFRSYRVKHEKLWKVTQLNWVFLFVAFPTNSGHTRSTCSKVPSPAGYRCRSASIWTRLAGLSCASCRSVIMTKSRKSSSS
ncbi:AGAP002789-PA [Anopheles gambiae str. PEST]|uniref:AGAP002789-PA n=1 Tax=Anopheles gambiae TaxID=7165 RepID=A0NCZ7_ANOGA|nr:AGAP002789-PA [Anopheles gambiae str. PEST]